MTTGANGSGSRRRSVSPSRSRSTSSTNSGSRNGHRRGTPLGGRGLVLRFRATGCTTGVRQRATVGGSSRCLLSLRRRPDPLSSWHIRAGGDVHGCMSRSWTVRHLDASGGAWTMALDTFTLIASQYALEEDALDDYDAVRAAYEELGVIDTYDAAVVTKDPKGKVKIVKKVEEPTRQGALGGLAVGLAVAIGAGLAVGGAAGAAIGATAGHVAAGMSRSDLKDLGELLDAGTSGLIVVAATDVEGRVEAAIQRGKDIVKKQVQIDADGLKTEIDSL